MNENYSDAKKIGNRDVRKAISNGKYPYIKALEYQKEDFLISTKKSIGLIEIPIDLIVGTMTQTRAQMFSETFLPIADSNSEFASKWQSVYNHQINDGISDPIEVYEYNHLFYVVEGNKRVSVSKYLQMSNIMADVTRIEEKPYDELYEEFISFFECTSIYDFYFSKVGSYKKLAKLLNTNLQEKWPKDLIKSLIVSLHRFRNIFKKRNKE